MKAVAGEAIKWQGPDLDNGVFATGLGKFPGYCEIPVRAAALSNVAKQWPDVLSGLQGMNKNNNSGSS